VTVSVGASPFTFNAIDAGNLIVSGGAVSQIEYSPTGKAYYPMGTTGGSFQMAQGSSLQITFTSPPSLTFFTS
jgi:hypothetical protein